MVNKNNSMKRIDESFFCKIKNWFKKIFIPKPIYKNQDSNVQIKNTQDTQTLRNDVRVMVTEEEKKLIKEFENGEIESLTDEKIEKIKKGYSIEIKNKINTFKENMKKLEEAKNQEINQAKGN